MKNIITSGFVLLALASCTKHTCVCSENESEVFKIIIEGERASAENDCDALQYTQESIIYECHIK